MLVSTALCVSCGHGTGLTCSTAVMKSQMVAVDSTCMASSTSPALRCSCSRGTSPAATMPTSGSHLHMEKQASRQACCWGWCCVDVGVMFVNSHTQHFLKLSPTEGVLLLRARLSPALPEGSRLAGRQRQHAQHGLAAVCCDGDGQPRAHVAVVVLLLPVLQQHTLVGGVQQLAVSPDSPQCPLPTAA